MNPACPSSRASGTASQAVRRWFAHPWIAMISCICLALYIAQAYQELMFRSLWTNLTIATVWVSLVLSVRAPRLGSWMALGMLTLSLFMPFPLPSFGIGIIMVLVGILGTASLYDVIFAVPIAALGVLHYLNHTVASNTGNWLRFAIIVSLMITSASLGTLLRQLRLRKHAERQRTADLERFQMARMLHDAVANDITKALLHVDDPSTQINRALLHDQLAQALGDTHHVIRMLERTDEPAKAPTTAPTSNWAALTQLLDNAHTELRQAGFDGEVLTAHLNHSVDSTIIELSSSVVRELATNIIKYANRAYPYVITLQFANDTIMLQTTNICRDDPAEHQYGMGSGLRRHQQQCEFLGGSLEYRRQGNKWSTACTLPLR